MERGHSRTAARRGRDGEEEDDHAGKDGGGDGAQERGLRSSGKQIRRQGGAPREGRPWEEQQREQEVERRERGGLVRVRHGGGRDDCGGAGGERKHADGITMGHSRKRRGRITGGREGRRERHR